MASCLCSAQVPLEKTIDQEEQYPDLTKVPEIYHDLKEVFNKAKATSLLPHKPYDCAIDLLLGTTPPRGRLFPLSPPEMASMNAYMSEELAAGLIRPSSSPAGAGFFFVSKKDGGLHPCIDYCSVNSITIKNRYPLPLMTSAFELPQGLTVYSKLDLRNWELLAVKLALEEWQHWLKGSKHPFTVLMDHKNLEYLRTAKRLNSCQTCWALFFSRLTFPFLTDQVPATARQTNYAASSTPLKLFLNLTSSFQLLPVWPRHVSHRARGLGCSGRRTSSLSLPPPRPHLHT